MHSPRKKFFSRLNKNDVGGKTDGGLPFPFFIRILVIRGSRGAAAAVGEEEEKRRKERAALERAGTGVV